jgi:uncharacterized membrane protein YhaH (DUF805 family)
MQSLAIALRELGFVTTTLIIAGFALATPKLRGKGWIAAWAVLEVPIWIWYGVLEVLLDTKAIEYSVYSRFMVCIPITDWMSAAGMACLLLFVVSQRTTPRIDFIRLFFSFRGRTSRQPFWVGTIVLGIIGWASAAPVIGAMASTESVSNSTDQVRQYVAAGVYVLWSLASVWPSLALQAKRWHDRDKSAWMILINFIPLVGAIWALIELGFLAGTPGANTYGEDPRLAADSPVEGAGTRPGVLLAQGPRPGA